MKKIISFLFVCLLAITSIFLMGCDVNTLFGEQSNESFEDILLPTAKKEELVEQGYTVNLIVRYNEIEEARSVLNQILQYITSSSDNYIEEGYITAILKATKFVDGDKETIEIYYCKNVNAADVVCESLNENYKNYSDCDIEKYGYTVTVEYTGEKTPGGEGGNQGGQGQNRDYKNDTATILNDFESNGWECKVINQEEAIKQISQELGLDDFDLQVVITATKVYGATMTGTFVILAEDSEKANQISAAINNSGFEKDSMTVKNADVHVTVNEVLSVEYFKNKLTEEGYDELGSLANEELVELAQTFNLSEGDVLGFVTGERVYPQDTSKEEYVSYVILKDETTAQSLYSQIEPSETLLVNKEGNLVIVTSLSERAPLDVELERLQSNGYTIDSVVDPENDVVGLLYDSSLRFGFEDIVLSFIINASKDTVENNQSYFCHYIVYGFLNEEYATAAFEKAQELYPNDLVSMQDLSVFVFHKEAGLDTTLNAQYPEMAQDKLLMEQNGWTCEIIELDSELNSFINTVNKDEDVDLTNRVYGYMRFTHPDYDLPFDVYYCKDARAVNTLYAYFATLPTYRVDTENPMKDNVGQGVDELFTSGPKDAHYILMGRRTE